MLFCYKTYVCILEKVHTREHGLCSCTMLVGTYTNHRIKTYQLT